MQIILKSKINNDINHIKHDRNAGEVNVITNTGKQIIKKLIRSHLH